MRLFSVIGARPHYMKVAPVHFEALSRGISHQIIHTGQHYDVELTSAYEKEFDLPPAVCNLTVGSDTPGQQMGIMMQKLDAFFQEANPDIVIVYGDTNSTAAAAITAAKNNIPVAHVEAGLREFRKDVPEEINKLLTDAVSDLFFCPTQSAVDQLKNEGKYEGVVFTGDIVYDLVKNNQGQVELLDTILVNKLKGRPFYFVSVHRQANTESKERLSNIVSALLALEDQVVFSIHPRTKKALKKYGLWESIQIPRIYAVNSRPFWETQWLIANAQLTLTDSGGISKESFFHGTGCILLDDQIEWKELVNSGWLIIAGAKKEKILSSIASFKLPNNKPVVFGGGNTAKIILDEIEKYHATRK